MAKQQTFADKSKAKSKATFITVKHVKSVKSDKGSYKFQERYVKIDDIGKVTSIK
jgi:hypothetical protein